MTESTPQPRVLKARDSRGLAPHVAFNFEDIRRRCEEEVQQARKQADDILRQAKQEAEQAGQQAFEEARKAGFRQGLQDAEEDVQRRAAELAQQNSDEAIRTTLPAVRELAETLTRERECRLADWETEIIRLSVAIAEKLVRRKIDTSPDLAPELIRETLQLVTGSTRLRVRLNPQDEAQLGEFVHEVAQSLAQVAEVHTIADETVSAGGCVVETEHGVIDGRLETQLERIVAELSGDDGTPSRAYSRRQPANRSAQQAVRATHTHRSLE